jgi:hypothetical protein
MIESLECPIHAQRPNVLIDEKEHLKISCCCSDFRKQCLYLIKKLLELSPKKTLLN